MELPHLGHNCSEPTCKKLDFLPIRCDACKEIFCCEHYQFKNHNCPKSYIKDNQVPICPLCNIPIPIKFGESPDVIVGAHIDNDCQSDPAKSRRKVFTNRCNFKGCKKKEIIPVICNDCKLNFCLKHRFPDDHKCLKKPQSKSRLLNEVANISSHYSQRGFSSVQGNMSEDEALARALSISLNDAGNKKKSLTQEELDFALAKQLQEEQAQPALVEGSRNNRERCNLS